MLEFINNAIWTLKNVLTVVSRELLNSDLEMFIDIAIQGFFVFVIFYFPSKWFRAYILRLFLFVIGMIVFLSVCHKNSILFSLDLYASIGIFLPHIEIVEITYLIMRERTLFIYDKITELFLLIISPFIWIYNIFEKIFQYFKIKQEQRENKKAEQNYYKKKQEEAYKQEQARYDENDKRNQEEEKKQEEPQQPKQEEKSKTYSRWDSSNSYEVLGINENATKQEIKKAYRNLSKIYHPDLTLFEKEKNTIIFQKINGAYESLK